MNFMHPCSELYTPLMQLQPVSAIFELQVLKWFCGIYTPDYFVKNIYTIYSRFKESKCKIVGILRKLLLLDLLLGNYLKVYV